MCCARYIFGLVCLFAPTTCLAQFDRIDNVISNIENRFKEKWDVVPNIGNANGFSKGVVREFFVWPLQWELEKLETRAELLEELIQERSKRLDSLNKRLTSFDLQLQEVGVFGDEDLQEIARRKSSLKHELKSINAQAEALKIAASQEQGNPAAEIRVQSAKEKLRALEAELNLLQRNLERQKQLSRSGVVPSSELEVREEKAESMRGQIRVAELDMQLAMVEVQFNPELNGELRKVTVIRDQLQSQFEQLSTESKELSETRKILAERKQVEFEQQLLRRRLAEMTEQKETVGLERRYLNSVLSKYQKISEKNLEGSE